MMFEYISLVVAVLTATVTQALPTPSFKLLETYTGVSALNGSTKSCTYVSSDTDTAWIFFDHWRNAAYKLPGSHPNKAYKWPLPNIDSAADYSDSQGAVFLPGMGTIWFASKEGSIREWELFSESTAYQDTVTIGTAGINGVCYDADTEVIYVTAPGLNNDGSYTNNDAGIWLVSGVYYNDSVRVYNGGTDTVQDQNDDLFTESGGGNYTFHPNACTVKDGIVYFIESRADGSGVLGVMTAGTDTLSIITGKLAVSGTSLEFIGDYLIAATSDSLLYYDTGDTTHVFTVGMDGLQSPGDFSVGAYNTMCVPSLSSGEIYFIRFSSRPFLNRLSRNFTMYTVDPGNTSVRREAMSVNIAWDPKRRKFAYINQLTAVSNKPDLNEISSQWPVDLGMTDDGFIGPDFLRETVIPERESSAIYQLADIANDMFYGTDIFGMLFAQDLSTENVVNYVETADYDANVDNSLPALSSVCIDPDNSNMAYLMDGYYGYMWTVDVSAENWVVNEIYSHQNITDQNGLYPRPFWPFDCTVMDGIVYMVEAQPWRWRSVYALGIYDIDSGAFGYDSDVLDMRASSIASSNGVIIISTLDYISSDESGVGFGLYVPGEMDAVEIQYYSYVDTSDYNAYAYPLQLAIDSFNGVVAYTYHIVASEGAISFMQSDEFMVATTTSPTTASPTSAPSTVVPTTSAPAHAGGTETTKDVGKGTETTHLVGKGTATTDDVWNGTASPIVCNLLYITLLIGSVVNYIN